MIFATDGLRATARALAGLYMLLLLAVCGCSGGGGGNGSSASLTAISVAPADTAITKGTTQQFRATGSYSDGSTREVTTEVTWSASDGGVATISNAVSAKGVADTTGGGTTTITAALSGVAGQTQLTVITLDGIQISPTNPSIADGATQQFSATGVYSDSSTRDLTTQVTWSTSDEAVAIVSNANGSEGMASAAGAGAATITATLAGISGATPLAVAALQAIEITPAEPALAVGTAAQLTATGIYSDASKRDLTTQVTWISPNQTVATISNEGVAGAVGAGTSIITATLGGMTGQTQLTVTAALLQAIEVTPTNPRIALDTTQQFRATGVFDDGSMQDLTEQVTWSSSDGAVCDFDADFPGLAVTLGSGNATIRAQSGAISGSSELTVTSAVLQAVEITPIEPTVATGTVQQLTAIGHYSDGSTHDVTDRVIWASSDETVATVSGASGTIGLVGALGAGVTTITTAVERVAPGSSTPTLVVLGSTSLTVAGLTGFDITPTNASIAKGTTLAFRAIGAFANGASQDLTAQVTWESSNSTVATVSNAAGSHGHASAIAAGTVDITGTLLGVSQGTLLTVKDVILQTIQVTPVSTNIVAGQTQWFTASGSYSDGPSQDLTNLVTWATSNSSVATVSNASDSRGLAMGLAGGTATIAATLGGISGTGSLSVADDPDVPVSLSLVAFPSVILNDGTDSASIMATVQPAMPSGTVTDGTRVNFGLTSGTGFLSPGSALTTGGQATTGLISSTTGTAVVAAAVQGMDVVGSVTVRVVSDFNEIFTKQASSSLEIINNEIQVGSRVGLVITNTSNRTLNLERFEFWNGTSLEKSTEDPAYLNGGSLAGGETVGLVLVLIRNQFFEGLNAIFFLSDPATGQSFTVSDTF